MKTIRGMWGPVSCTTPVSILNSEATERNAWRKTTGWPNRLGYLVEDVTAAHHRPHVTVVRDLLRSSGSGLLHQGVRQPLSVESRLPPLATLMRSESFMLPTNSLSPSLNNVPGKGYPGFHKAICCLTTPAARSSYSRSNW